MSGRTRLVEAVMKQFERCEVSTTRKFAGEIVDTIVATIKTDVRREGQFAYSGFGTWKTSQRKARDMDVSHLPNSKDMGVIHVPASTTVRFAPSKSFKEWLNEKE